MVEDAVSEGIAMGYGRGRGDEESASSAARDDVVSLDAIQPAATASSGLGLRVSPKVVRVGVGLGVAVAAGTLVTAVARVALKWKDPASKRARTVNKNKLVVEAISAYLPGDRAKLTAGVAKGLCRRTGFTATEVFRKYLWYLLQEREFTEEAVGDMVHLRTALGLTDEQVADAVAERARRIRAKMGPVMFSTKGMSADAIARKATERAFFAKLMYLSDRDDLLDQAGMARERLSVADCFDVRNPSDVERMRLVSLENLDLSVLEELATTGKAAEGGFDGDLEEAPAEDAKAEE